MFLIASNVTIQKMVLIRLNFFYAKPFEPGNSIIIETYINY